MNTSKIRKIVGNLATVKKIRGQNRAVVTFNKNWGHGSPAGGNGGSILGRLTLMGVKVERACFGNVYEVAF